MIQTRLLRAALGWLLALAVVAGAGESAAQISIVTEVPDESPRPLNPEIINKEDCELTTVTTTFSGLRNGETVQVWVSESQDCTLVTNRTMDGSQCFDTGIRISGTSNANNTVAEIELREVLNAFPDVDECVDETGVQAARQLQIFYMVDVTGTDITNSATSAAYTGFDLVGADPPTLASLTSADETILTADLEDTNDEDDFDGYTIYCELIQAAASPPSDGGGSGGTGTGGSGSGGSGGNGTAGSGGATGSGGTAGSGGTGGIGEGGGGGAASGGSASSTATTTTTSGGSGATGVVPDGSCSRAPTMLVEGEFPSVTLARGNASSDTVQATGLSEGEWACGVAGTDNLENPGVLSNVLCASTAPVTDFFEAYRDAGGLAGGGYCQCSLPGAPKEPSEPMIPWMLLTGLAGSLRLRRPGARRRRSR
ncbi:MAG: hypothetical protein AAF928_04565 [Myxococcota bacterium]